MADDSPKEFAIELVRTWTPYPNQPVQAISIPIPRETQGWANPSTQPNTAAWVEIDIPVYKVRGYVPRSFLSIGARKGFRVGSIIPEIQPMTIKNNPASFGTVGHILGKTLKGLLLEMSARTAELASIGTSEQDIESLKTENPDFMDVIRNHMVPQAVRVLKNGVFGFNDLLKLPAIDNNDEEPGIYIIAYEDVGDNQNAIYIGKTVHFASRMRSHRGQIESTSQMTARAHYSVARKARKWRMMPLFRFVADDPHLDQKLRMIEQVSVMLLHTWNRGLFVMDEDRKRASAHAQSILAARTFSSICRLVFEQTGWPLGIARGLNWTCPLVETSYTRTIWRVSVLPNKQIFRRGPLFAKLNSTKGKTADDRPILGTTLFQIAGVFEYINLTIPIGRGIKHRTKIFPGVEVMTDGTTHPIHFTRFPKIGPFTDWSRVNSFAIFLDYQTDDGKWKRTWLENYHVNIVPEDTIPESGDLLYAFKTYQRMSYLLDTLQRIEFTKETPAPSWRLPIRPIVLQKIDFHHLTQTLKVSDVKWQPQKVKIGLQSFKANEQALRQQYPGIIIGVNPRDVFRSSANRKACDYCYIAIHMNASASRRKSTSCNWIHKTNSCQQCYGLRRPCTYTEHDDIVSRRWETLGLRPVHDTVHDIDGFVIKNMGLDDTAEDDDDYHGEDGSENYESSSDDDDNDDNKGEGSRSIPKAETVKERAEKARKSKREEINARKRESGKRRYRKWRTEGEDDDEEDDDEGDDDEEEEPSPVSKKKRPAAKPSTRKGRAISKKKMAKSDYDEDEEELEEDYDDDDDDDDEEPPSFSRKSKAASRLRKGKGRAKEDSESEYEEGD